MNELPEGEDTIRVRRTWSGELPGGDALTPAGGHAPADTDQEDPEDGDGDEDFSEDLDEDTQVSRRRAAVSILPVDGRADSATVPAASAAPHVVRSHEAPRRRRSTYVDGPAADADLDDGSTIVARRESRRRAAREAEPPAPTPSSDPTSARSDASGYALGSAEQPQYSVDDQTYPVRHDRPVIAPRTPPIPRTAQPLVDGAAVDAHVRRSRRRTAMIVVSAASAIAITAAVSLLAIFLPV